MSLEMRRECERCGVAFICSYECIFCERCAVAMDLLCPNCGGELVTRSRRRPKV